MVDKTLLKNIGISEEDLRRVYEYDETVEPEIFEGIEAWEEIGQLILSLFDKRYAKSPSDTMALAESYGYEDIYKYCHAVLTERSKLVIAEWKDDRERYIIMQDGANDFSVGYFNSDCSVRGTMLDIITDLADGIRVEDITEPDAHCAEKLLHRLNIPRNPTDLLGKLGITLDELHLINMWGDSVETDREDVPGFVYKKEEQWITNIFTDNSGRFPLSIEEAVQLYGMENVRQYCQDVLDFIRPFYNSANPSTENVVLITPKGKVTVRQYGINDFALFSEKKAIFSDKECLVRGSLLDVIKQILTYGSADTIKEGAEDV